MTNLSALYNHRFGKTGLEKRKAVWRVLTRNFFSKLVPANSTVLDVACGYGEFINNIVAAENMLSISIRTRPSFSIMM